MVSFASDTVQGTQDHSIYILLTRSGTWFSRLIHLVTSDCYTHASIGLDGPSGPFYSFARRYEHFALPAGLVEERPGVRNRQIPCCLYELKVSDPVYRRLRRQLSITTICWARCPVTSTTRSAGRTTISAPSLWPRCWRSAARWSSGKILTWCAPPTSAACPPCKRSTRALWTV